MQLFETERADMLDPEIAKRIDHTLLRPDATAIEIKRLCSEAVEYRFGAVCIAPCWVADAAGWLSGQETRIVTVIGFPHGNMTTATKVFESTKAIEDGAHELDMVMNIGFLKSGYHTRVFDDIRGVVTEARQTGGALAKVILETALLDRDQKIIACKIAEEAGADFVKTSTGFASRGATTEDVALMRQTVGNRVGVKAAGGISDAATLKAMFAAGATRIGASRSVNIMKELRNTDST